MRTLLLGRHVKFIDWAGWLRVDAEEKLRGIASKKPREKLTSVAEMLRVAS
jgi:ferredoxin--NADP+ reductase